jgi:Pyridoxamine 5'-phosphate oxidase
VDRGAVRWAGFEAAAPGLAARARELIERFRFVLAGTIRRDGTPRISPVEAHLVEGELVMAMIGGSLKARDLLRDPRLVLNTPVTDASDPNTVEVKLRGRAVEVNEPPLRAATAAAIEHASGWRPPPDWHVFALELGDAAVMAWQSGVLTMDRWTRRDGVQHVSRPVAVLESPGGAEHA